MDYENAGALVSEKPMHGSPQFLTGINHLTVNAICPGNQSVVRIHHPGCGITAVKEHLLPLSHIAEPVVVEYDNFDSDIFLHHHSQFLDGHLNTSVSTEKANGS